MAQDEVSDEDLEEMLEAARLTSGIRGRVNITRLSSEELAELLSQRQSGKQPEQRRFKLF